MLCRNECAKGNGRKEYQIGIIYIPFTGSYETILLAIGFKATLPAQSQNVMNWISFAFHGFDLFFAVAWILVLPFLDLEKKMPVINADLLERKKQAEIARGEEWIEPEELGRREQAAQEIEHDESRIADLRARCEKKGLDFDTENLKNLVKKAETYSCNSCSNEQGLLITSSSKSSPLGTR